MNAHNRLRSVLLMAYVAGWIVLATICAIAIILSHVDRHWIPWTITIVPLLMVGGLFLAVAGRASAYAYTRPRRPRGGLYIPPEPARAQLPPPPTYRVVDTRPPALPQAAPPLALSDAHARRRLPSPRR